MAKRKSKSGNKHEDTSLLLLESSAPRPDGINAYVLTAFLCLILATGGSTLGWFCAQQQHTLDQLSQSYTAMQTRITELQQVMGMRGAQMDTGLVVEERVLALEEAQKRAQQKAEVALATSEKLKNTDLHSQIWALRAEMDTRLSERRQVAVSAATLRAVFKNQSDESEAVKERVVAILSSSSELAASVAGLTSAVASTNSRVDEQVTSMEALDAQLEGQDSELNKLKVSLDLHKVALYTNNQEVVAMKEFVRAERAMRALALEEKLSSVQRTLDEQFFTSQTLHSNIKAQLQNVHTQLVNGGQIGSQSIEVKSSEEGPAAEEFISATAEDATVVQEELEDVEEQAEKQDAEEAADEQVEEEALQEEQPLEQEVEGEVTEEPQEEEITGQSEEREVAGETAEEEVTEDTVEGQVLEESLEESVMLTSYLDGRGKHFTCRLVK